MTKLTKIFLTITSLFFITMASVKAAKLNIDVPEVTDHEKVTIYLFRGDGCPHCNDFLTFFNAHADQFKDYFEIVAYETYNDENNRSLKALVDEKVENTESGVPFIVYGNQYKVGFGSDGTDLIKNVLAMYEDDEYEDVVQEVIKENDVEAHPETLEEACLKEGITKETRNDGLVVAVIFLVLIGGFAALVLASKKK